MVITLPDVNINSWNPGIQHTIIPFLKKQLINHNKKNKIKNDNQLYNLIKTYLPKLHIKYQSTINHIQNNILEHMIGVATLTIEINNESHSISSKYTHTKTTISSHTKTTISSHTKTTISSHTKNTIPSHIKNTKRTRNTKHNKQNTTIKQKNNIFLYQLILICIDDTGFQNINSKVNNNDTNNDTKITTNNGKNNYELLESLRLCGNTIYNICKTNYITKINLFNTFFSHIKNPKLILSLLEGLFLSSYKFDKYKTDKALNASNIKFKLENINLICHKSISHMNKQCIPSNVEHLKNIVKTVFLTRNLINEPANDNKTDKFITTLKTFIKENNIPESKLKLRVLDKNDLMELGMGLILAVGKGSNASNDPKMLIMEYTGNECARNDPAIVLIGKGITFDTGGMNLKSGKSMIEMKSDLSGGACISAFLSGYALNHGKKCITAIIPFAENSIGPNAIKPSDVVKAYDGRTVEITNTDAEGRLLVADCLAYAIDKYPKAMIIDFATIAGQQEALSDKMFSNILGINTDSEIKKLINAGNTINELLVPLPINGQISKSREMLKSYVADIKNADSNSYADIIMSTLFMKEFIKKDTKWIHIDIAGPSYNMNNKISYISPEASGIGVRLLFEYFQ